jgi:hypothetical protein
MSKFNTAIVLAVSAYAEDAAHHHHHDKCMPELKVAPPKSDGCFIEDPVTGHKASEGSKKCCGGLYCNQPISPAPRHPVDRQVGMCRPTIGCDETKEDGCEGNHNQVCNLETIDDHPRTHSTGKNGKRLNHVCEMRRCRDDDDCRKHFYQTCNLETNFCEIKHDDTILV